MVKNTKILTIGLNPNYFLLFKLLKNRDNAGFRELIGLTILK